MHIELWNGNFLNVIWIALYDMNENINVSRYTRPIQSISMRIKNTKYRSIYWYVLLECIVLSIIIFLMNGSMKRIWNATNIFR